MNKKLNLKKISASKSVSSEERQLILNTKKEDLESNKSEPVSSIIAPVVESKIDIMLSQLNDQAKFVKEGSRQQSSINTSDYTTMLINILIEAKKEDGEKIKKTSYLEKYLVKGLKEELKEKYGLNIK